MTPVYTILFVDDDRDFLDAKRAFFEARGHTVHTVEAPDDALHLLETLTPDIIFLDLMMDQVDSGFRLGYQIGKDERLRGVPRVMLSGVAAETGRRFDGEAEGLREWSGLDQFIDKPVTGKQLLKVLEERVGAGRQQAAGTAGRA
jgi:CheY-like chemotaxis protein